MTQSGQRAFLPIGAAYLVLGALSQPAFLGIGAAFLVVGVARRRRQG